MRSGSTSAVVLASCLLGAVGVPAQESAAPLPEGYWGLARSGEILDKTLSVRLAPDLSHLSASERQAVELLLEAGEILHTLYLRQNHQEAEKARADLVALADQRGGDEATQALLDLFWISRGPIVTTLDNERVPFLPVSRELPGRNLYPPDATREELEAFLARWPAARDRVLDLRSVVRRTTEESLAADLAVLRGRPELGALHPGLEDRLAALARAPRPEDFYAVPYSVAWPRELARASELLRRAANSVAGEDPDLADFLRLRSRDLLVDDYEAGDAAWVSGSFGNLNAQVGSYETYDDKLFGVKSFFSLSVLARDRERSEELAEAIGGLQEIEDSLPYDRHKRVRSVIPVNVYNVVADFGQSRGTNTATILPNEERLARKYGRTILLRYNIMTHPDLFAVARERFRAATKPDFHDDLTLDGGFQRTLWHEVGHYLGVDRTLDGRGLEALEQYADLMEELKSDLVSLFAVPLLAESAYYDAESSRAVYASGILRVLQPVEPRREQPYQTMQLMQWNWFLDQGVLEFDPETARMAIDYERYPQAVAGLLRQVLDIQASGDPGRAAELIERWGGWREDLHEVIASRLREAVRYRYRKVTYGALDRKGVES